MRTKYRIDDFQESYFVIPSLRRCLPRPTTGFRALYVALEQGPTHEAGAVLASDRVLHRGDRSYRAHSHAAVPRPGIWPGTGATTPAGTVSPAN